jgi:hypothetical protein
MSADMLLFEKDERGPDEKLRLQFEALSRLDPEEEARSWSVNGIGEMMGKRFINWVSR